MFLSSYKKKKISVKIFDKRSKFSKPYFIVTKPSRLNFFVWLGKVSLKSRQVRLPELSSLIAKFNNKRAWQPAEPGKC